jgi:probable Rubsico expression protein CbbX
MLDANGEAPPATIDFKQEFAETGLEAILRQLDAELVGLAPVKTRIREIAALLLVERVRRRVGLSAEPPTLHMSFTGNPGTGKTTVALRMADILHRLGYIRKGHLVSVTRDDLVGQYIGHTAPKTKEILKKAMGGVLFIDEAYYLYRQENERDYGQEAIEILLQVMENQREDLVVILAGYADRMDKFFRSNPGFRSRIAHHIEFPDYTDGELLRIAEIMLGRQNYQLTPEARDALVAYIAAPFDPQCSGPGAAAAGEPGFCPGGGGSGRGAVADRRAGHPRQPRAERRRVIRNARRGAADAARRRPTAWRSPQAAARLSAPG